MSQEAPSLAKAVFGLLLVVGVTAAGVVFITSRSDNRNIALEGDGGEARESERGRAEIVLSYERSGGYSGGVLRIVVRSDGFISTTQGAGRKDRMRRGHLDAPHMNRLTRLFDRAPWPNEDRSFDKPNTMVADGYVYDIVYDGVSVFAPDARPRWLLGLAAEIKKLARKSI